MQLLRALIRGAGKSLIEPTYEFTRWYCTRESRELLASNEKEQGWIASNPEACAGLRSGVAVDFHEANLRALKRHCLECRPRDPAGSAPGRPEIHQYRWVSTIAVTGQPLKSVLWLCWAMLHLCSLALQFACRHPIRS